MRAFHTLRTKNSANFKLDDFEILTLIISALKWREHSGEIFLMTDSVGKKYIEDIGIAEIYNGIEAALDELDDSGIDEKLFWAGCKIFALMKQPLPCVSVDLDFILWQKIDFEKFKLAVIHRESTNLPCYPDKNYFHFKNNFNLPENLNWSVEPSNAALVYFGDKKFVEDYCAFAMQFMKSAAPEKILAGWDALPYMVFVEQRWLSMCADNLGIEIHSLSNIGELFGGQKFFTHLWGHKSFLRENPAEAEKFCRDCAGRISHDFADFAKKFSRLERLKKYF